ncbi:unnamed protein product [Moneuplotes crassus]|uniref:Uncharacterized protein n=1 Tax=Euplotes crassus TaxID=5936 RepID=A0AAD2D8J6_EUPCR|nr:unnamed protein product [Moneuplotes crassus]
MKIKNFYKFCKDFVKWEELSVFQKEVEEYKNSQADNAKKFELHDSYKDLKEEIMQEFTNYSLASDCDKQILNLELKIQKSSINFEETQKDYSKCLATITKNHTLSLEHTDKEISKIQSNLHTLEAEHLKKIEFIRFKEQILPMIDSAKDVAENSRMRCEATDRIIRRFDENICQKSSKHEMLIVKEAIENIQGFIDDVKDEINTLHDDTEEIKLKREKDIKNFNRDIDKIHSYILDEQEKNLKKSERKIFSKLGTHLISRPEFEARLGLKVDQYKHEEIGERIDKECVNHTDLEEFHKKIISLYPL